MSINIMELIDIPNEIINKIIYQHLSLEDIRSCLVSSKIFHVLSGHQKNIINNAKKGWIYCIKKGHLETSKWLYQLGIDLASPIDIHVDDDFAFRWSCYNGHLETSKWLCTLYSGYTINLINGKIDYRIN